MKALLFATVEQLPSLPGKVLTGWAAGPGRGRRLQLHPRRLDRRTACGFVVAPGHPVAVRVLAGECASPAGVSVSATVNGSPLALSSNGAGLWSGSFAPSAAGALLLHAVAGDGSATAGRTSDGQAATEMPVDGVARSVRNRVRI